VENYPLAPLRTTPSGISIFHFDVSLILVYKLFIRLFIYLFIFFFFLVSISTSTCRCYVDFMPRARRRLLLIGRRRGPILSSTGYYASRFLRRSSAHSDPTCTIPGVSRDPETSVSLLFARGTGWNAAKTLFSSLFTATFYSIFFLSL
jgi:hypothetical protein